MTSHVRVETSPDLMEVGLALNVVMIGSLDTVTVSVTDCGGIAGAIGGC